MLTMISSTLIPACEDVWHVRQALVVHGVQAHTRMSVVRFGVRAHEQLAMALEPLLRRGR